MKKILFGLLILSAFAFRLSTKETGITGTWQWVQEGNPSETGLIIFDKNNYVTLIQDEDTMGGENYYADYYEEYVKVEYKVNTTVKPHHLDWIVVSKATGKTLGIAKTIFELPNDSTLKLIVPDDFDEDDERPTEFDNDDSEIFYRVN